MVPTSKNSSQKTPQHLRLLKSHQISCENNNFYRAVNSLKPKRIHQSAPPSSDLCSHTQGPPTQGNNMIIRCTVDSTSIQKNTNKSSKTHLISVHLILQKDTRICNQTKSRSTLRNNHKAHPAFSAFLHYTKP